MLFNENKIKCKILKEVFWVEGWVFRRKGFFAGGGALVRLPHTTEASHIW